MIRKKRLSQKDQELLREFRIWKEVQIKIKKLKVPRNIKEISKALREPLLCSNCDYSCSHIKHLTTHIKNMHKHITSFKCRRCKYSGSNIYLLIVHEQRHSSYYRFKCSHCKYKTNNSGHLNRHVNCKHNETPEGRERNFPCQLCTKSFYTNEALRQHSLTHTAEKKFPCQFCSRFFARKPDKNVHEIICTKNPKRSNIDWVESQKRFKCNLCGVKKQTRSQLTNHIRTHTGEKPFKCALCDYAGATAPHLTQHRRTHTVQTAFGCEFCNGKFTTNGYKKSHMIICKLNPKQNDKTWVDAQKKFKCDLCDYSSVQCCKVKRHRQTHNDGKKIKCPFCKRTFSDNSELNIHMRRHTGEKPFQCLQCKYSAVTNHEVTVHTRHNHRG